MPATTNAFLNGGENLFVAVLDDTLRLQQVFFSLGGDYIHDEFAMGLAVIDDVVVTVAEVDGEVTLDDKMFTSSGSSDILLATFTLPSLELRSADLYGNEQRQRPFALRRRCDGFVMGGDFASDFTLGNEDVVLQDDGFQPNDMFVSRMRIPAAN
jgi:hypothetical protein